MRIFPKVKNWWPAGLVIFFILFGGYIAGFVIFASSQRMDLVREDYYDQEIRFQKQIDRVNRSAPVLADASIVYSPAAAQITVSLPSVNQSNILGTITFYRPSDAGMDASVKLGLNAAGSQSLGVGNLQNGLWRVRVQWTQGGQEVLF